MGGRDGKEEITLQLVQRQLYKFIFDLKLRRAIYNLVRCDHCAQSDRVCVLEFCRFTFCTLYLLEILQCLISPTVPKSQR